jgi:hypothetical protein
MFCAGIERGGGGWATTGGRQLGGGGSVRGGPEYSGRGLGAGPDDPGREASLPGSGRCQ